MLLFYLAKYNVCYVTASHHENGHMQEDNQNVRYWPHSLAMCFKIGAGHFEHSFVSNIVLIAIFCCCC